MVTSFAPSARCACRDPSHSVLWDLSRGPSPSGLHRDGRSQQDRTEGAGEVGGGFSGCCARSVDGTPVTVGNLKRAVEIWPVWDIRVVFLLRLALNSCTPDFAASNRCGPGEAIWQEQSARRRSPPQRRPRRSRRRSAAPRNADRTSTFSFRGPALVVGPLRVNVLSPRSW